MMPTDSVLADNMVPADSYCSASITDSVLADDMVPVVVGVLHVSSTWWPGL